MCSTARLSLPKSVFYLIRLAVSSVSAFSEFFVVDMRDGPLEARLTTSNKHISALERHNLSKSVEIVGEDAQVDGLEGAFE